MSASLATGWAGVREVWGQEWDGWLFPDLLCPMWCGMERRQKCMKWQRTKSPLINKIRRSQGGRERYLVGWLGVAYYVMAESLLSEDAAHCYLLLPFPPSCLRVRVPGHLQSSWDSLAMELGETKVEKMAFLCAVGYALWFCSAWSRSVGIFRQVPHRSFSSTR